MQTSAIPLDTEASAEIEAAFLRREVFGARQGGKRLTELRELR
jgi:hypothetical protein